jgi:hypothetical protein
MTINIKPITEDQLCGMGGYTVTSGESEIKIGQDYYIPQKYGPVDLRKFRVVAADPDLEKAVLQERELQGYFFGIFELETFTSRLREMTFKELRECVRS